MMDYQTYVRSPDWEAKRQEKLESCINVNAKADVIVRRHKFTICITTH